jgi:hypothetical protein
VLPYVD